MKHQEHFNEEEAKQPTEQERRARLISRYIEKIIAENPSADEEEEKEIREDLATLSPREKADRLYEKLMAYRFDKQAEAEKKKEEKIKSTKNKASGTMTTSALFGNTEVMLENGKSVKIKKENYNDDLRFGKKFRVGGVDFSFAGITDTAHVQIVGKNDGEELYNIFESDDVDVADNESAKTNPSLISEMKILFDDEETKKAFDGAYGEARVDAKIYRLSELGNVWENTTNELKQTESKYKEIEKDVFLDKIEGRGNISVAKSKLERLAKKTIALEKEKENLRSLKGLEHTEENTDAVAMFQYQIFEEYQNELNNGGFVWLPSRKEIHKKTVAALQNGRWPLLKGEAGSGKSEQADAAACELTGFNPTKVACDSKTGEIQLIQDVASSASGESYYSYGALMSAFTGYENSLQMEPKYKNGRIVRLDEALRMGTNGYSIIKEARQTKPGDDFHGHPMLPGAGSIWTSNPEGMRYPDRHPLDPAMRREVAEIEVDYPENSNENPELYEFMVTALMDENHHIPISKKELAPFYKKNEISEDERETLSDGSIVIAKEELKKNKENAKHGTLWRLAGAVKAIQDSFVYGNASEESEEFGKQVTEKLLRFKDITNNGIEIDGNGTPLTLSSSTITLGEVASWMKGFGERREKANLEYQTETFTDWIKFKCETYLGQVDSADREKVRAIFTYFHLLEGGVHVSDKKPMTPKEIGYLSPRVPRPFIVEKPKKEGRPIVVPEKKKKVVSQEYENIEVLLENGDKILIQKSDFDEEVKLGVKFIVDKKEFSFVGVSDDGNPVGQFEEEKGLHKIFDIEDIQGGIMAFEVSETEKEIKEFIMSEKISGNKNKKSSSGVFGSLFGK